MAEPSDKESPEPSDGMVDANDKMDRLAGREPPERSDEDSGETDSTNSRHWLTNDLLVGFLDVAFVGIIVAGGAGWLDLQTVPWYYHLTFVTLAGTATVWAFGPAALQAWNDAKVLDGGEE